MDPFQNSNNHGYKQSVNNPVKGTIHYHPNNIQIPSRIQHNVTNNFPNINPLGFPNQPVGTHSPGGLVHHRPQYQHQDLSTHSHLVPQNIRPTFSGRHENSSGNYNAGQTDSLNSVGYHNTEFVPPNQTVSKIR